MNALVTVSEGQNSRLMGRVVGIRNGKVIVRTIGTQFSNFTCLCKPVELEMEFSF